VFLFLKLVAPPVRSGMIEASEGPGGVIMVELRRIVFAGVGGGLLLLTGCATPMFGGGSNGCPREGLFSRLFHHRNGSNCPCPCGESGVIGTTVSSVPVITGPVHCPCPAPIHGGAGGFIPPTADGPILPPTDPTTPYPHALPGVPPTGVIPGTPAPGTLPPPMGPIPGEARPVPAGPSSRRA
jgi:hypothetical protein